MEVNGQTGPTGAVATTRPQGAGAALSQDFDTFLKMLTAQMNNQDPLNPLDSSDFAVQLATFSGVEQQIRTNDLLAGLADTLGGGGLARYADWVGKDALTTAPVGFDGTTPIELAPHPAAGADRAELVVRDEAGDAVQRIPLEASGAAVAWGGLTDSGTLPAGLYSFSLESYSGEELLDTSPVEACARISEVRMEDGAPVLILAPGTRATPEEITGLRAGTS